MSALQAMAATTAKTMASYEERGGETSLYSQARITAKGLATISKTIEKANRTVKQLAA